MPTSRVTSAHDALSLPPNLIGPNSAAPSARQRPTGSERHTPASGPRSQARRRPQTRRARAAAAGTSSAGASARPAARPRPPGRRPCPWRRSRLRGVGLGLPDFGYASAGVAVCRHVLPGAQPGKPALQQARRKGDLSCECAWAACSLTARSTCSQEGPHMRAHAPGVCAQAFADMRGAC